MFTPKIYNPIPNNTPATEILLKDQLITNDQLKDFFTNIPKRLDLIENADDVSNELDVLALTNDVTKNKSDIIEMKNDIDLIGEIATETQAQLGDSELPGTINSNLAKAYNTLFDDGGLFEMTFEINDELATVTVVTIPEMQSQLDAHEINIVNNTNSINQLKSDVLTLENLTTQIDVNTSNINVLNALVASMNSQIEQIRTECNNKIQALEERIAKLE